jgi:hypothetical protein
MKQLAMAMANLSATRRRRDGPVFLEEMEQVDGVEFAGQTGVCQGREWGPPVGAERCCGFTFCSSGSTCPTPGGRSAVRFGGGCGSLWGIDLGLSPQR